MIVVLPLLLALIAQASCVRYHDYIIIGAGPSGLQLGHFMNKAGRDYVILEKGNNSGTFFETYPRHDKLISLNKRNTGQTNKEFNLRHDWNSLISDDESLQIRHYSKEIWPHRTVMLKYLSDYERKLGLNVQHNTEVTNIHKELNSSHGNTEFHMDDQNGNVYACKYLIVATGMFKPNIPEFHGSQWTEGYEDIPTDPDAYEGQTVLILGRGNAAFEVADSVFGSTNLIHMIGRSRVRLSWATHYVGDLRAVNNALLDNYQLKSLDGLLEAPLEEMNIVKQSDGRLKVELLTSNEDDAEAENDLFDNFALRDSYDRIIRCLGFRFDDSIFASDVAPAHGKGRKKKYPKISADYMSTQVPNMYFAGTNTHSLDHRKSAGGFIHGFRYTALSLHHLMEQKHHSSPWPVTTLTLEELIPYFIKRINEASGTYQMFGVLCDVIAIRKDGAEFEYFHEYPLNLLHDFAERTGHEGGPVIVVVMEYGKDFSGPGNDVFKLDRATGEPSEAHNSNFLHPVLYYYKQLPTETQMSLRGKQDTLPRPTRLHHMVEDFLAMWDTPVTHILPLRRFIENILDTDIRHFFAEECFQIALTSMSVPVMCNQYLQDGYGLPGTPAMLEHAQLAGLLYT